jgi:hypothetical protein
MAEIKLSSGLITDRARVVDDPRDKLVSAADAASDGKPKDEMQELSAWVLARASSWRDHRRQNYEQLWDVYERAWRGLWEPVDKSRKSERSTLVTPALGEAVENIVAEVEEAIFGRGDFFDIKGELSDEEELKKITDKNKAHLKEDLGTCGFVSNIGEALINGAVYGSGIGEILIESFRKREIAASMEAMMPGVAPEAQVIVTEVSWAVLQSVNPRNFLIDPTARTVDGGLGCAIEEYVGAHIIKAGQKAGKYRDVDVGTSSGDTDIGADRQMENEYPHDKVKILRYYGFVPRHLIFPPGKTVELYPQSEGEALGAAVREAEEVVADLSKPQEGETAKSGEKAVEPIEADMVEAVVIIANDTVCLKGVENPYLMQDRPVVAFPWDIVPGRFWGRGVCEKGLVPHKALDAEMRARIDALAYISAPMMAMDASKLPRGFQLVVRPGKSVLTNGDPNTILRPMHFGQLEQSTFNQSQQLDQMIQRATGSLDVIALAQRGGDARPGAVSMMLSGIVKRHKRTLLGFIEKFFIPALRKIMWRNMQFYPERYAPFNWSFVASSTMGILQREYETQNLTALMQTMEPQSPEYKMLLMGVVANTGLTHRTQIIEMLKSSIQQAQQAQQMQMQQASDPAIAGLQNQAAQLDLQLKIAKTRAEVTELEARSALQTVKAQNQALEPQFRRMEIATKGIYQVAADQQKNEFDRRLALADRVLKNKDIESNERIARIQAGGNVASTHSKSAATVASEQIRARAQPKAPALAPAPAPTPIPVPVPVPRPVPIPMPFGGPLVGRQARLVR